MMQNGAGSADVMQAIWQAKRIRQALIFKPACIAQKNLYMS